MENLETSIQETIASNRRMYQDAIRGCIVGGAVGDALGYPVEFMQRHEITARYGAQGITDYALDPATGTALVSDDTQMTLFTATGIMLGDTRLRLRGIGGYPPIYVRTCYLDWLGTQMHRATERPHSWLVDVPQLHARRAPGNTCLEALVSGEDGSIEHPLNHSKGCGGVMRVAPMACYYKNGRVNRRDIMDATANIAAITHGHTLGWLPAAMLVDILSCILHYGSCEHRNANAQLDAVRLANIISDAETALCDRYPRTPHLDELLDIVDMAVDLSRNADADSANIARLGEGWVAEETLAIALYCALRHTNDFSAAVIAAVNHSGDSDSTGSVTGNIVGMINGYRAIGTRWTDHLELLDVILEVADDLCDECQVSEYGTYDDPTWMRKYAR